MQGFFKAMFKYSIARIKNIKVGYFFIIIYAKFIVLYDDIGLYQGIYLK